MNEENKIPLDSTLEKTLEDKTQKAIDKTKEDAKEMVKKGVDYVWNEMLRENKEKSQ